MVGNQTFPGETLKPTSQDAVQSRHLSKRTLANVKSDKKKDLRVVEKTDTPEQTAKTSENAGEKNAATGQEATAARSDDATKSESSLKGDTNKVDDPFCVPLGTKFTREEIWSECPFKRVDGKTNPEIKLTTASTSLSQASEAIQFNAIIHGLTRDEDYARQTVDHIRSFFTNEDTGVLPNAEYAQIIRGRGQTGKGSWAGLIEWRHLTKVVNGIMILRASRTSVWTGKDDAKIKQWASVYLEWLTSSGRIEKAKKANNNQTSFLYSQLISLNILLDNLEQAKAVATEYFETIFPFLLGERGSLPTDAARSRPKHYVAFAIEAILNNAKMADDLGLNFWQYQTKNGSIQDVVDFAIDFATQSRDDVAAAKKQDGSSVALRQRRNAHHGFLDSDELAQDASKAMKTDPPSTQATDSDDRDAINELAPHVFAAMNVYGDSTGRYARFLAEPKNTADPHKERSFWFMHQPCSFRFSKVCNTKQDEVLSAE